MPRYNLYRTLYHKAVVRYRMQDQQEIYVVPQKGMPEVLCLEPVVSIIVCNKLGYLNVGGNPAMPNWIALDCHVLIIPALNLSYNNHIVAMVIEVFKSRFKSCFRCSLLSIIRSALSGNHRGLSIYVVRAAYRMVIRVRIRTSHAHHEQA